MQYLFNSAERRLVYFAGGPEAAGSNEDAEQRVESAPETREGATLEEAEHAEETVDTEVQNASEKIAGSKDTVVDHLRTQADTFDAMAKDDPENAHTLQRNAEELRKSADAVEGVQKIEAKGGTNDELQGLRPGTKTLGELSAEHEKNNESLSQEISTQKIADDMTSKFVDAYNIPNAQREIVATILNSAEFTDFFETTRTEILNAETRPANEQELKAFIEKKFNEAPPALTKQVEALQKIEEKLTFPEMLKNLITAIEQLFIDAGLIKRETKKGREDVKGDTKGLDVSRDAFAKSKKSPKDSAPLENQKKTVSSQLKDAKKGVIEAEGRAKDIDTKIAELQKEINIDDLFGESETSAQTADATDQIMALQKEATEVNKEIQKREQLVKEFAALEKQIDGAIAASNNSTDVENTEIPVSAVSPESKTQSDSEEASQEQEQKISQEDTSAIEQVPVTVEQREAAKQATAVRVAAEQKYYGGGFTTENAKELVAAVEAEIETKQQAGGTPEEISVLQKIGRKAVHEHAATVLIELRSRMKDIINRSGREKFAAAIAGSESSIGGQFFSQLTKEVTGSSPSDIQYQNAGRTESAAKFVQSELVDAAFKELGKGPDDADFSKIYDLASRIAANIKTFNAVDMDNSHYELNEAALDLLSTELPSVFLGEPSVFENAQDTTG